MKNFMRWDNEVTVERIETVNNIDKIRKITIELTENDFKEIRRKSKIGIKNLMKNVTYEKIFNAIYNGVDSGKICDIRKLHKNEIDDVIERATICLFEYVERMPSEEILELIYNDDENESAVDLESMMLNSVVSLLKLIAEFKYDDNYRANILSTFHI